MNLGVGVLDTKPASDLDGTGPASPEERRTLKIVLAINATMFVDVIANLGVIVAAGLVHVLNSNVPDLVVAAAIASVVLSGAIRILRLKT